MANRNKLFSYFGCRFLNSWRRFQVSGTLRRNCSSNSKVPKKFDNSDKEMTKTDERGGFLTFKDPLLPVVKSKYWNERKAIKQLKKKNSFPRNVINVIDLVNGLVYIRKSFPGTLKGFIYWLQRLREKQQVIEQKFLPQRHAILRPDLAAANFLVRRGGSVKFVGQTHWVGIREKQITLPNTFVPGLYVEAINLEGSNLYFEGLKNICDLNYLKSLSLKNLEHVDDWWLDWISTEYYLTLKYLDLTGCKNVSYRGLSCFYRFESLETLNVEGVSDSPEFKLACIMLQDIMPKLDIIGIDLNLPKEIKAVGVEQNKILPSINDVQKV